MIRPSHLWLLLIIVAVALPGCIRRTLSITSEPEGALVHLNDEEVGRTPVEVPFTFYGLYDVRLEKAGYATLNTTREAEAPLADTIGVDLFTEMLPGTVRVNLDWHFQLNEASEPNERNIVSRGRQLRALLEREATGDGAAEDAPADDPTGQSDAEVEADATDAPAASDQPEADPGTGTAVTEPTSQDEMDAPNRTAGDDAPEESDAADDSAAGDAADEAAPKLLPPEER